MALESVYLIIIQFFSAKVLASYASSPYFQYEGYPTTGYMYTAQSYTPKPAPAYAQQYSSPYQPYSPPAPNVPGQYQPAYSSSPVAPPVPKYQQATQPPAPRAPTSYQPGYTQAPATGAPSSYQSAYASATPAPKAPTSSYQSYTQAPATTAPTSYQPAYTQATPASKAPTSYQSAYAQATAAPTALTSYQSAYAQAPAPARLSDPNYQPAYSPTPSSYATYQPTYPTSTNAKPSQPSYTPSSYTYQTTYQQTPKAAPVTPTSKIDPNLFPMESPSALSKPDLLGAIPPFDSNILNNLAIALQLLIVSNLIYNPPNGAPISEILESPIITPLPIPYVPPESSQSQAYYDPNPYDYLQSSYSIPNANFLASTGFSDTGISKSMMSGYGSPTPAAPRTSGLMSPYDAIAKSSYTDATKKESKSPYHLSSDYNDLFSLTELFKI